MEIKIEKLDNEGKGIGYVNNKIIFVPKTLPGDIVEIKIIKDNKKYYIGEVTNIISPSLKRIKSKCEYFNSCGGCNLLNLEYDDTLEYKKDKIKEIFKKYLNINILFSVISCNEYNYRNKVTFHIKNNKFGLIDEDNELIEIQNCLMISSNMNKLISFIKCLNIKNGKVLIRENYKGQILLSIDSLDKINISNLDKSIVGVIHNGKIIYKDNFFIENVSDLKFKVSYNSFFQINRQITDKLFTLIKENIQENSNVLDLYCGVGTLGIVSSKVANKVIGIDNAKSNINDAKYNAKLNNIKNIEFICADASTFNKYVDKTFDTIIVDPPRNGLNKDTLKNILEYKPNQMIYISCNSFTLVKDLKDLLNIYDMQKLYLLDMFPFTHHIECFTILSKK